jgi:hypothetical protein
MDSCNLIHFGGHRASGSSQPALAKAFINPVLSADGQRVLEKYNFIIELSLAHLSK